MRVGIKVDSTNVLTQLRELGQDRQGPFVLAKGLNILAKQVQVALRGNIDERLNLRRKGWVNNQVKIDSGTWATKTRLKVTIFMTDSASFLADFETGAEHVPVMGRKYLAIPNRKVFGNAIIGESNIFKVKNLNLHETPRGLEGNQQTFVLHTKSTGTPLIMQEVDPSIKKGRGKRGVNRYLGNRILYTLVHATKRPQRIQWYSTANATVVNEQVGVFTDVIKQAIKDARK